MSNPPENPIRELQDEVRRAFGEAETGELVVPSTRVDDPPEVRDQGRLGASAAFASASAAGHALGVRGGTKARALAFRTGIRVEGGAKSGKLPAERVFDGTPDPEIGRMVRVGQTKYHLDTLRALDAESRQKERVEFEEATVKHREAQRLILVDGLQPTLAEIARVCGLPSTPTLTFDESVPIPYGTRSDEVGRKLEEAERKDMEEIGREMARAVAGGKTAEQAMDAAAEKLDAALEKSCGSAGCRTLPECLCTCKQCRTACRHRRR